LFKLYNLRTLKYLLLFILLFAGFSSAQDSNIEQYQYISPLPDSKLIMPESNIIIRQGDFIDQSTIKKSLIQVVGSISGVHPGDFFLSDDMRTLIFIPSIHFTKGEKVKVELKDGISTMDGNILRGISFDFMIADSWISNTMQIIISSTEVMVSKLNDSHDDKKTTDSYKYTTSIQDSLPLDFPTFEITEYNNPSEGYLFLAPYPWPQGNPGYLTIVSNEGVPIFYRRMPKGCSDFKLNHNGLLSFGMQQKHYIYMMDSSYKIIDSVRTGNGYTRNGRDFQILPNGHYLLMAYDPQLIRMDTIVPGGDTAAVVIGLIIQELDATKHVIFQWRSWDHYQITDATEDIDLTQHTIDYVHGNALELDFDGNILISTRHMDEITKINRQTGEIIWRFGGIKSRNNQFLFINDPRTFSHQHDIRRLPNGNITLFDNGNLLMPRYSSSLEYYLDEQNKTATLIWEYHDQSVYSSSMGSSRRSNDGHTVLGWGSILDRSVTEVSYDGTKTFEFIYDFAHNYRAFRFPWRTNLLIADSYIIDFEYITANTIDIKEIVITNNSNEELQLTSYYSKSSIFSVVDNFPITFQPYQNKILQIQFSPDSVGVFSDDIHLRMQKEYEMIAQVINVLGSSDPSDSLKIENNIPSKFSLTQNYPNPFNLVTTIRYSIPTQSQVRLRVYNSIGENITDLINANQMADSYEINWNASNVASGIYFYSMEAVPTDGSNSFRSVRKMILIK